MADMTDDLMPVYVDTLIEDGLVVTMDGSYRVFERGSVAITGDEIVEVGPSEELKTKYEAGRRIDARNRLVMPGLINTHTHSAMTIFRGFADDISLKRWLYDHVFPMESRFIEPENVRAGTRLAIAEMLLSGTTTFNDMYYYTDEMARVVDQTGMRAVLNESLIDFPVPNSSSPDKGLAFTEKMLDHWKEHPLINIGVAVHTPYTGSPDLIRQARAMADRHAVPFIIHLAETKGEFDEIMEKHGVSPVELLNNLDVLDNPTMAAHCVFLTDRDIEILASKRVGVSHNPQCNMKLASGAARLPELLEAGVNVGVGTDGVASNNDLDMIDEIRSMAFLHKFNSNDPTVVSAREAVEMATMGGARVLGLDRQIGSLEKGKKADLILLNMDKPHAHPLYNIYSLIVYSMRGADVETVMVNGRFLVEDARLMTLDLGRLYDKVEGIARQIRQYGEQIGIFSAQQANLKQ